MLARPCSQCASIVPALPLAVSVRMSMHPTWPLVGERIAVTQQGNGHHYLDGGQVERVTPSPLPPGGEIITVWRGGGGVGGRWTTVTSHALIGWRAAGNPGGEGITPHPTPPANHPTPPVIRHFSHPLKRRVFSWTVTKGTLDFTGGLHWCTWYQQNDRWVKGVCWSTGPKGSIWRLVK